MMETAEEKARPSTRICPPHCCPPQLLLLLLVTVTLMPKVHPYGFRNCIEDVRASLRFRCIQRFLESPALAVSDLPPHAVSLNLSYNLMRCLQPSAFARLPRLLTLDLAYNHLETLSPGAFNGLGVLVMLNLSHNRLTTLAEGVFNSLGNLSSLWVQHNPLSTVSPGALLPLLNLRRLSLRGGQLNGLGAVAVAVQGLAQLEHLDLCENNLTTLGPGPPLPASLHTLQLCNNSLGDLAGGSPEMLWHVKILDLSYNSISQAEAFAQLQLRNISLLQLMGNPLDVFRLLDISDIQPRSLDFSGLVLGTHGLKKVCLRLQGPRALQRLRLQRNGLKVLQCNALASCPVLQELDLSWNRLQQVGCAGQLLGKKQQEELEVLTVEHNLLKKLPSCQGAQVLPRLYNISFRFNRILTVGFHAFAYAPALQVLQLNINSLVFLDRQALRGLHNLTELRLDNNLLTDLYNNSFIDLHSLRTLNLRNNRVSVLFPGVFQGLSELQTLDLGGNNLRHLASQSLQGLSKLRRLYLDRNRLLEVSSRVFAPVQATLGVLDLRANNLQYISQWLHQPPPFRYLSSLYDLKLQAQQPYGLKMLPHHFFQGLVELQWLSLSQNMLRAIPPDVFEDLGKLRSLTLADSSNGIHDLPEGIFRNLSNLQFLDLENVGLHSLTLEVFGNLSQLQVLRLARNELKTFNASVASRLSSLRYVDLRKCPLSCTCDNTWLQGWLNNSRVQVVYPYNYTCGSQRNAYVHSFDTRVCFLDLGLYLFAGTAPAVLLLLVVPLVYHRTYWRLRYHWYLLRCWVNQRWRREEKRYLYDSFVSYNSADESWVLQKLVPELERGAFRLCLHHRDFQPGRSIIDNIVDAVYNSRKTVCVMSRSYLRSEWCSLEVQLASYRLLDERRDILVLVLLEDVGDAELSAYHRMRRVLLRRTYLRWPLDPTAQPLFWARLKRALRWGEGGEEEEGESLGGGAGRPREGDKQV
ncbi:toll-like receptor 13 isoform X1 [Lagopus muta]|uniref:toll-like receptor 13 isoform X1 n=1 Tax=Lagopus muta TaxID=64668 RepID=UPI0020A17E2E|nr:toll-like receptor 13 isoform X1 [Lagopus muta]